MILTKNRVQSTHLLVEIHKPEDKLNSTLHFEHILRPQNSKTCLFKFRTGIVIVRQLH